VNEQVMTWVNTQLVRPVNTQVTSL